MANVTGKMNHFSFSLQRSRLSIALHIFMLLLICFCLYQALNIWMCFIAGIGLILSYIFFLNQKQLIKLEWLDQNDWSLKYSDNKNTQTLELERMLDHQLYIVLYFYGSKPESVLIWQDQLSMLQWKSLKSRAKLH